MFGAQTCDGRVTKKSKITVENLMETFEKIKVGKLY